MTSISWLDMPPLSAHQKIALTRHFLRVDGDPSPLDPVLDLPSMPSPILLRRTAEEIRPRMLPINLEMFRWGEANTVEIEYGYTSPWKTCEFTQAPIRLASSRDTYAGQVDRAAIIDLCRVLWGDCRGILPVQIGMPVVFGRNPDYPVRPNDAVPDVGWHCGVRLSFHSTGISCGASLDGILRRLPDVLASGWRPEAARAELCRWFDR